MEQEIKAIIAFFDDVEMPEHCARRVAGAMEERASAPKHKEEYVMRQSEEKHPYSWIGAAACLVLLLAGAGWFFSHTDGRLAATDPVQLSTASTEVVQTTAAPTEEVRTTAAPTETEENEALLPEAEWLYRYGEEDGERVFLSLDDNWIEITDKLSADAPVVYCYEPEEGKVCYYAVGLCDGKDPIGWYYNEYTDETGWAGGTACNNRNQDGTECLWYTACLERQEEHRLCATNQRHTTSHHTEHHHSTVSDTTGALPSWLEERDGALYFVGYGEEIDISDAFTKEEPFYYTYTDEAGMETLIAVGGTYIPGNDLDTVGWAEWTRDTLLAENLAKGYSCWKGGYGHNTWDNEADDRYAWYHAAKDHFGIPWSF